MDDEYDVIVLGTGMVECVLSGMLSVTGKKVLHTDRNGYYGGESTSMNLKEIYNNLKKSDPPSTMGQSRDWCIDSILKLIMVDDRLVEKLRCCTVYKYLTFQQIDGSFVYRGGKLYKVPATETEVLSSPLLGLFQKRYLHRLLSDIEKCDLNKNQVPSGLTPQTPMLEVYNKYSLDNDNKDLIGHVLALYQNDDYLKEPCIQTFKRMNLYKTSLQAYGKSPYIYPSYGLGEIPQAFARLSAVYGGTYILNFAATGLDIDESGAVCGVKFGDKTIKTKCVIGDPSYFPERVKKVRQVVRCICLLDHPIKSSPPCESCQIIIPANQDKGRKSDVYVSVISPAFNTSPKGYYVAIVATNVENKDPFDDVKKGVEILKPVVDQFLTVSDIYEPLDDGSQSKVYISKSYDATTHFESACGDIDDIWKRLTGKEFDEKVFADLTKNSEQQ